MKRIQFIISVTLLFCLHFSFVGAEILKPVRIKGQIKDFLGGNVSLMWRDGQQNVKDTVLVTPDGKFDHVLVVKHPVEGMLGFEEYRTNIPLFLESGMQVDLQISFHKEKYDEIMIYVPDCVYTGKNADCTQFIKDYDPWRYGMGDWPFERIATLSFADYRRQFLQDIDSIKASLTKVQSLAFKREKFREIDENTGMHLFRYALATTGKDADFARWAEAFDRNDPQNQDMARMYMGWYLNQHPAPEGVNPQVHFFDMLKEMFTNQEMINTFADINMEYYLKDGPGPEEMSEALEAYKQTTTNAAAIEKAEALYAHYSRLTPGAEAIDFTMEGTNGKTYRLSDFRGRALYIDVWATWCGPCCMEIPYVEKLVAHYKGNRKIEFLSISLDKDRKKWLKKLAEDRPEWKQFICPDNFKSELCKNYDIDAIPRFLFFDKKGRIISLNAPRPSSEKIIEFIDSHL